MTKHEFIEQAMLAFFSNPSPRYTLEDIGSAADAIYGDEKTTFRLPDCKDKFLCDVRNESLLLFLPTESARIYHALEVMWDRLVKV